MSYNYSVLFMSIISVQQTFYFTVASWAWQIAKSAWP